MSRGRFFKPHNRRTHRQAMPAAPILPVPQALISVPAPELDPEPGPINFMPDEIILLIAAAGTFDQAVLLGRTNKRNYSLLRLFLDVSFANQFDVMDVIVDRKNAYGITRSRQVAMCKKEELKTRGLQIVDGLFDVKQALDSGDYFNIFIKHSGEVFAKGLSFSSAYPQTYIPATSTPAEVAAFKGQIITKAMDDGVSACFLSDTGQIRVVGKDGWGELGQGVENKTFNELKLIENVPFFHDFHYTREQLLLFSTEGLLVTGKNDLGQLGVGHNDNVHIPILMPLNDIKIKSVKVGDKKRFYGLTPQGRVCAWGYNEDGMLGFGDQLAHNVPALLPGLYDIVDMDVDGTSALFVDKAGKVFVFGTNISGKLGMGDMVSRVTPTLNPHLPPIQKVFCKPQKSFFTSEGKVFFAGTVADDTIAKPQLIFDNPESIKQIDTYRDEFIYRASDGALHIDTGEGRELKEGVLHMQPKLHLFPAVNRLLEKAKLRDLLYYASGQGGFARHCLQLALTYISRQHDVPELVNLMKELNTSGWRSSDRIREILPAYHSVLSYANAHLSEEDEIVNAWASMLIFYRKVIPTSESCLPDFVEMLTFLAAHNPLVLFRPPLSEASQSMLDELSGEPSMLKIVAKFFLAELPPLRANVKRGADGEAEDEKHDASIKKAKK